MATKITEYKKNEKTSENIAKTLFPYDNDDYNKAILRSAWALVDMGIHDAIYYSQSSSGTCFFEYAKNKRLQVDSKMQAYIRQKRFEEHFDKI